MVCEKCKQKTPCLEYVRGELFHPKLKNKALGYCHQCLYETWLLIQYFAEKKLRGVNKKLAKEVKRQNEERDSIDEEIEKLKSPLDEKVKPMSKEDKRFLASLGQDLFTAFRKIFRDLKVRKVYEKREIN